jgi:hypothetical protein
MPAAEAPAAAAPAAVNGDAGQDFFTSISRVLLMYCVMNMMFKGPQQVASVQSEVSPDDTIPAQLNAVVGVEPGGLVSAEDASNAQRIMGLKPAPAGKGNHRNLFRDNDLMTLEVFLSEEKERPMKNWWTEGNTVAHWREEALGYNWDGYTGNWMKGGWEGGNWRNQTINVTVSEAMLNNASMYAHIYFTKRGFSPNPVAHNHNPIKTAYKMAELIEYRMPAKVVKKRNLLGKPASADADDTDNTSEQNKEEEEEPVEEGERLSVPHWKPTLTLHLVHDFTIFPPGGIPENMAQYMEFDPASGKYYPVIYHDEFWLMKEHLIAINSTLTQLELTMSYTTIGLMRWQMQSQMERQWQQQADMGTHRDQDTDEVKRMIAETNPFLLGVTGVVSMLHMLFDILAFKNDISFWRKNKSLEGLSVRTICLNAFFQMIIFLYLMDNDTSWMILFSSGIGLLIEFWKIQKAFKVKINQPEPEPGSKEAEEKAKLPVAWYAWFLPFKLEFETSQSYTQTNTAEYDEIATRHLSFLMYPAVLGYSLYSLYHNEHKSWYSWVISSLVGFIYMFGFIMMTPQLYINYRLKSVAHLPWRAMVYKSLNTFIDDLFAFIIKMPMMHRLACFRDDLIFFVYLYQRYIYKVDKTRVNEYGQVGEEVDPEKAALEGFVMKEAKTLTSSAKEETNEGGPEAGGDEAGEGSSKQEKRGTGELRNRGNAKDKVESS